MATTWVIEPVNYDTNGVNEFQGRSEWEIVRDGTYDILAIVVCAIQNQGDHQDERIYDATLDRVHDHTSIKSVHSVVRSDLCRPLGLPDPPDQKSSDDEIGYERD